MKSRPTLFNHHKYVDLHENQINLYENRSTCTKIDQSIIIIVLRLDKQKYAQLQTILYSQLQTDMVNLRHTKDPSKITIITVVTS